MSSEATEYRAVGELRLDDETSIVFAVYSLGKRRLGSARIYREGKGYAGPTRFGFDMQFEQIGRLVELLSEASNALDSGQMAPPVELEPIPSGSSSQWIVRLLEPDDQHEEAVVDVRKYVTTQKYTGWTKKGLRFSLGVLDDVIPQLVVVRDALSSWREGRSGLFEPSPAHLPDDSDRADAAPNVPDEYLDLF